MSAAIWDRTCAPVGPLEGIVEQPAITANAGASRTAAHARTDRNPEKLAAVT
jgi:hypothetical protein